MSGRWQFLSRRGLMRQFSGGRIEQAIAAAERRSSGEIRVSIAPLFWGNVRRTAERAFERLGMTETKLRNGVLLFVVPARRRFVVLGDMAIHDRVGEQFWQEIAEILTTAFAQARYEDGLIAAIERIGDTLAQHFPPDPQANPNELSDKIDL